MPLINFSGIASGIDSEALIKATSDAARAVRVTPQQNKIKELEGTNDAFSQLKAKLAALQSILQDFASTAGGPLSKSAASSDETVLRASASTSAANGSYTITVTQLAKNGTQTIGKAGGTYSSSEDIFSPNAAAPPGHDNLTIEIGTAPAETAVVEVDNTTTLNQVVSSINDQLTTAVATIINVGTIASPSYKIVITSTKTGTSEGSISVSSDGGITGDIDTSTYSAAANAIFSINGIGSGIERTTNSVTDIIPGLTLNFIAAGGPSTITIADDANATTSKVQEFITAYNEVVGLIQKNNKIERVEKGDNVTNIFGPLSLTNIDDNVLVAIRNAMSASAYSSGSEIKIFADLGITTDSSPYNSETNKGGGTLKFDSTVFKTALSKEPNSVNEILKTFGDTAALVGGTIDQFIRFNGLIDTSVNANKETISDLNDRIANAEAAIAKQEELMRKRFASLESTIGKMQNQASALSSILTTLPKYNR